MYDTLKDRWFTKKKGGHHFGIGVSDSWYDSTSVVTFHSLFAANLWISWNWWIIVLSLTGKARWKPTGKNFFSVFTPHTLSAFLGFVSLHIPSGPNYVSWGYISVVTAFFVTWHSAEDIAATCLNSWKLGLHRNMTYAVKEVNPIHFITIRFVWRSRWLIQRVSQPASYYYRGADKSLARPGRKQATATEDFEFNISYL